MDENKASLTAITDRMKLVLGVQTDKEVSVELGRSPEFVSVRKNRGTIPFAECVMLAMTQNISLDWLILGRGEKDLPTSTPVTAYEVPEFLALIKVFDAGDVDDEPDEKKVWYLPRDWLASEGLDPEFSIAVRVVGDSMEPTISEGHTVLVSLKHRDKDGVYLLRFGDGVYLRRMQHMIDGSVRLSCDNPAYAAEVVPAADRHQLSIIGYCHSQLLPVR